jgi:hypothetical protein
MADVGIPRQVFQEILPLIAELRPPPQGALADFESRTAPEQKMESTAVFVLAKLLAAIVSDWDDIEEIAQTVYDRILRIE